MKRNGVVAVAAFATIVLGAAGCGSDSPDVTTDDAATQTTTAQEADGSADGGAADGGAPAEVEAPAGGPGATVIFDGEDISDEFAQGYCEFDEDDGVPDVEFEADRTDNPDDDLHVEIDLHDPPQLEELEIETAGGAEWETGDAEEAAATVTVDGDTYQVSTEVVEDDGPGRAQVDVTFMCG